MAHGGPGKPGGTRRAARLGLATASAATRNGETRVALVPPPERARGRVARIAKDDFLRCFVSPPGSAFVGVQELAGTMCSAPGC